MLKLRLKNNKHSAVWLVEPKVSIGTAPTNGFVVADSSVEANHAEVLVKHENLTLVNLVESKPLSVNGKEVENSSPLNINDVVTIGNIEIEVVDPKLEQREEAKAAPKVSSATGWALKSNHAALANRVFTISPKTIVGRSNECDITLAAAHLSRRHAELTVKNGLLYVKDLGSANGTFINGSPVTEARVKRGDELKFDTLSFGVIGPSEDLDKTSIRPVAAMPKQASAKSAPRSAGASPVNKESSANKVQVQKNIPTSKATNNTHSENQNRPQYGATADKPRKGKPLAWFIVLGLVVACIAVAYSMGLLP